MIYRTLGTTGLKVSALGFGAMRLPMTEDGEKVDRKLALPMFRKAFEGGVNYVDSAVGYCKQDSQRAIGDALAEWFADGHPRDSIVVSTKNPLYDKTDQDKWWKNLEDSLARLKVDFIDCYHHHFLQWKTYSEHVIGDGGHYQQMLKAKEQGLIRHIGFSFHDTPEYFLEVIDSGLFEFATCQYNLIDRKNEEAIAHAHQKGMGIIIMGPVAGGRLSMTSGPMGEHLPEGVATTPELALRFVLSNPNVTIALSGMTRMSDVQENLKTGAREEPLSAEEKAATEAALERLKGLADLYCTGCKYCEPACPEEIRISDIFHHAIVAKVYGNEAAAIHGYAFMKGAAERGGGKMADACTECGKCEEQCPQNIPIREQLKQAREALDKS